MMVTFFSSRIRLVVLEASIVLRRSSLVLASVGLLSWSTACNSAVFSPPARVLPLESAATLPRGDIGIQAEGAGSGAAFGVSALSGTIRARRGMSENLDGSVEATLVRIGGDPAADVNRSVVATRVGAKYRVLPSLALTGGLGGGGSAAGGFMSPDVGAIVAWENRYVVPFASVRGGLSQPIGATSVDVTRRGDPIGTNVGTPKLTWLVSGSAGLRVPIAKWSVLGGVGVTHLADVRDKETVISLGGGVEAVF